MGKKKVADLRARFERDGVVEFRLRTWKVVLHLAFYAFVVAFLVGVGYGLGPVGIVLGVVVAAWFVGAVGMAFWEQVRGEGPPLKVDTSGLTLRRWGQPLVLPWGEVEGIGGYGGSRLVGPLLAIFLSPDAWEEYRDRRPVRPRRFDRFTSFTKLRMLTPFKVLDTSSRDLIAFFDREVVLGWIKLAKPPKLLLAASFDETSPVTYRNGVEVPLAQLPISESLTQALTDWNDAVTAISVLPDGEQDRPFTAAEDADMERLRVDGRALAVHLASELGAGAVVRAAYDPIG